MSSQTARPEPFFIADHPALDFLNSVASPRGEPIDWIDDGASYLGWLRRGFDVPRDAVPEPVELNRSATRARALREWFRRFVEMHAGRPLTTATVGSLRPLNELLAGDSNFRQVVSGKGEAPLELRTLRHNGIPDAPLQILAQSIADLVCHGDFTNIRHCEGAGCTLWFLDVSKGHRRRWCSMSACGNRAKVAQHRARIRGEA